jgi:ATP-binding cassette subfamily C protein CydC
MALSTLLGALTIASSLGLMMTSAWLIARCALQPSIADLGVSIVAVRFFGIARAVFRYLERLVSHDTTFRILAKLRVDFYRTIEPLAPARFSRYQTGDLLGRVVADVESLQELYLRAVAPPVVALVTGVGVFVLFAAFNWLTAITIFVFMLLTGLALPLLVAQQSKAAGRELITTRAALNTAVVDNIQGMAELLAYGVEDVQIRRFETLSMTLTAQQERLNIVESLSAGATVLLVNGAALAVLISAVSRVDALYLAALTLGVFAAFEAFTPLAQVARQWDTSMGAAKRLFEITQAVPAVNDSPIPVELPAASDLVISALDFAYSPQTAIFAGLNLNVKTGERIAILGSSGSGKSTLANVLARFWEYPTGSIQLGGIELKSLSQTQARQTIAILSQQAYLFNTSILENIRIAQPTASDDLVIAAANNARLEDFIATLPHGYNTLVGENGAMLSGGERRRIGLARLLLTNAPIVILDEPTAYLDTPTERAILETIFDTLHGRTLILLTHRHTLLSRVDHVYRVEGLQLTQVR